MIEIASIAKMTNMIISKFRKTKADYLALGDTVEGWCIYLETMIR